MKSHGQQREFAMARVSEINQRFKNLNGAARSLVPQPRVFEDKWWPRAIREVSIVSLSSRSRGSRAQDVRLSLEYYLLLFF